MKVYCIGTEGVVRGFALIGIEGAVPADPQAVETMLADVLRREDVGLVLVTERLAAAADQQITAWSLTRRQPLVLEIPDEAGPVPDRRTVLSLVKEALGLGQTDE